MTRTRIVLITAIASLIVSPAAAVPMIGFIDNQDSSVTLQVEVDESSSVGIEISVTGDLTLTDASIADPTVFDTPNPGMNPFTGGETFGLYLDELANGNLFVSYGSDVITPGVYDFLTIGYSGMGTIDASGVVAQLGVLGPVLTASIDVVPEPSAAVLVGLAVAGAAARRRV